MRKEVVKEAPKLLEELEDNEFEEEVFEDLESLNDD